MIDPALLRAYQQTEFIVSTPDGEITLQVGQPNPELDHLLNDYGATSCAFITAWNPSSVKLAQDENTRRQNDLVAEVRRRGYALLAGRGVGHDGKWPPEDSILIVGASRTEAAEIGRLFGQLCVVYAERGLSVELLFCET